MIITGKVTLSKVEKAEMSWSAAEAVMLEALPWAEQVIITGILQPLVEMTAISPDGSEKSYNVPDGPLEIWFTAKGEVDGY